MSKERIKLQRPEGALDALFFEPAGDGPWPLVVFYMDAFGLRPALEEMAERLNDAGYAVLQPNLYWRSGPFEPFEPSTVFDDPDERARIMALMHAVKVDQVAADTLALVDEVAKDGRVDTERFGCVGYCMGGRMAFCMAEELPDRVAASASIHPGGLVTDAPDSPHLRAGQIQGVVYLGIADEDRSCTSEHQQALREALDAAGVDYTLELYAGAKHGFAIEDHSVYDEEAAERHWQRVLELFDTELKD
ncbi:MAG: dienelactone hydrolase family protein [Gemmatimonadota bacterium]|jgi:carboxymethylenebutenolidase